MDGKKNKSMETMRNKFYQLHTDVTHHFYVSSLGESNIEIKVQKQCGKTLFGKENFISGI